MYGQTGQYRSTISRNVTTRRGHDPALHSTSQVSPAAARETVRRTKAFPFGEGGTAQAVTDEGSRQQFAGKCAKDTAYRIPHQSKIQ